MLGRLGHFDGVVGNAIMLPLWLRATLQASKIKTSGYEYAQKQIEIS